jgi:hypothetical protein
VIKSPWLQLASEYRRFGHPPRLNHWPCWTQAGSLLPSHLTLVSHSVQNGRRVVVVRCVQRIVFESPWCNLAASAGGSDTHRPIN